MPPASMALSPESVSKDVGPAPEELTRVESVPGPTAVEALPDEVSPEDEDPPPPLQMLVEESVSNEVAQSSALSDGPSGSLAEEKDNHTVLTSPVVAEGQQLSLDVHVLDS